MDFDQLLVRFFGTDDIDTLSPEAILSGVERLRLQFGLEKDGGRRFGLWCLMYMLGAAPDLDVAFEHDDDKDAARDFMDMIDGEIEDEGWRRHRPHAHPLELRLLIAAERLPSGGPRSAAQSGSR